MNPLIIAVAPSTYGRPDADQGEGMPRSSDVCIRGHQRTVENVATNGDCRLCVRSRAASWKKAQPFPCGHARTPENTRYRRDGRPFGCAVCPPKPRPSRAKVWFKGEKRVCNRCGIEKDVSEFYTLTKAKTRHRYPAPHCKACHNEAQRKYSGARPVGYNAERWRRRLQRKYGLSPSEFAFLEERAGGLCELCGEPENAAGPIRSLAFDHCHETGTPRGFLCVSCNTKLGWLEKVGLRAVTEYLARGVVDP